MSAFSPWGWRHSEARLVTWSSGVRIFMRSLEDLLFLKIFLLYYTDKMLQSYLGLLGNGNIKQLEIGVSSQYWLLS